MQTNNILITSPSLALHDAVSNDVWKQAALFRRLGWQTFVYAEFAPVALQERLITRGQAELLVRHSDTLWIYHHSVFWEKGASLLREANCRAFMRYHNITPPQYFSEYGEKAGVVATKRGITQTRQFVESGKFCGYLGASRFNANELVEMGADRKVCEVVAPLHSLSDFESANHVDEVAKEFSSDRLDMLFVGRIVANKGYGHLLKMLDAYIDLFGGKVCLHLIGNIRWAPKRYLSELKELIRQYRLGDHVRFWGSVDFDSLHTAYSSADVFVAMSEHEGFCVPLIEAQYHRLPVVAYRSTAVGETLGENQVLIDELDYDRFAVAAHVAGTEKKNAAFLAEAGFENQSRFALPVLEQQLKDAVLNDQSRV